MLKLSLTEVSKVILLIGSSEVRKPLPNNSVQYPQITGEAKVKVLMSSRSHVGTPQFLFAYIYIYKRELWSTYMYLYVNLFYVASPCSTSSNEIEHSFDIDKLRGTW